jgi:hypothetical protein
MGWVGSSGPSAATILPVASRTKNASSVGIGNGSST